MARRREHGTRKRKSWTINGLMDFPMLHLHGRAVNVLSLDLNVPASTGLGRSNSRSHCRALVRLYVLRCRIGAEYDGFAFISVLYYAMYFERDVTKILSSKKHFRQSNKQRNRATRYTKNSTSFELSFLPIKFLFLKLSKIRRYVTIGCKSFLSFTQSIYFKDD